MSMDLDHEAFARAFTRIAKRLDKTERWVAGKYDDLPDTLEELIEDSLDDVALPNFITLLVMREIAPTKTVIREKTSLSIGRTDDGYTFYAGDLHVRGNLAYEQPVLVQGDVVVDGVIEDAFESSPLLVGGNVTAKAMYLGSETYAGGSVTVEDVLHLRFTRGGNTLVAHGGAKTKLYIYTPDDSKLTGKLTAKYQVEAYPDRDDPALAKLRALLTPKLAKKLDAEEPEMTLLAKALRAGESIWR
jgi:hypothetical protein